ncbi:hypothetical protein T05_11221 [Trichinella murrelli]|uniref:Uncharacterized protein n=1 Tax=Trichinella murrelli TaxID=144512 RepID=A0A0V0T0M8_9BILA|nr:hypothetical protein T05_2591 [Trichinella murrelli]KRX32498.1 hypothetical protein T05_11221 [Trichinella murrelli]
MKKVFLKAPSRVQLFKEMAPEFPLTPQPVLTRWEEEESAAVKIVHEIMQKESLRCDLVFIANFANFVQAFTFLEKRSETLVDRLQVFDKVIDNIHKIPGIVGEDIKTNKYLKEIKSIAEVLTGKSNAQVIGMNIESAVCFKYAPVTSAETDDIV